MKAKVHILNGQVINIGEWKFIHRPGKLRRGKNEKGEDVDVVVEPPSIVNPIPEDVVVEEREVVQTEHGIFLASDYQRLRRDEYPSVRDQLDALWKGGAEADAMRSKVQAVKTKYPKPQ